MPKFLILFECPQCGFKTPKWFAKQFSVFTSHCRCGASLTTYNPRFTPEQIAKMPVCCDCGNPIPPSISLHRYSYRIPPLSKTCPQCFAAHSRDEPGVDLDQDIMAWLKDQVHRRCLAKDRLRSIMEGRVPGDRKEPSDVE
jgi:hypothetical protein